MRLALIAARLDAGASRCIRRRLSGASKTEDYEMFKTGLVCRKCHETADHHIFIALMIACGARSSTNPTECNRGGQHEYVKIEELQKETQK